MLRGRKNRGIYVAYGIAICFLVFLINTGLQAYAQAQTQRKNEIKEEESYRRPEPTRPIEPEVPGVNRYQEDKVFLEYADSLYKRKNAYNDTVERQILKGNVKFRQSGLWMYCDSAYYYPTQNSLDAFSNVRMEQGDTLFVYADQLFYNGDEHLAKLKNGPTREKVTLINKDVTLTTDSLDYDMEIDLGWYVRWGTIDDKVNTLTSLYGQYSPKTKLAEFFTDVELVNQKDGFTMLTDTLYYSTETHIANIESRTLIQSENDTIITNQAIYYTDTGDADLLSRSLIIHRDSTGNVVTLEGDSIIYDNTTRISRAYMYQDPFKRSAPMVINDTAQKTTLIGGFGIYNDSTKEALATMYPLLIEYSQGDSIFLRADTIKTFIVTEMVPVKKRKTKSGFPEWNGEIIVMKDTLTGKLWIDTTFFKVRIPFAEKPLQMLMEAAPPYKAPEEPEVIVSEEVVTADSILNQTALENTLDSLENFGEENQRLVPVEADTIMTEEIIVNRDGDSMDEIIESPPITDSVEPGDGELNLDDLLTIGKELSSKEGDLPETEGERELEDWEKPDSIAQEFHVVMAYYRARVFKQDMQGVADSILFVEKDSMLYMFRKPILWSSERQVTGNRIDVHFNDSTADWAYLPEFGLMSEYVDEDFYNQIFGKEITAYFENQELRKMNVSGNVETIFLPQESDSTYNRLVNAESSYMEVLLDSNKLDWMKMWPEVSGTVTPIFLVKRNQMYLQKFKWWGFLRPERQWYGDRIKWADNLGEVPDELEQYFLAPSDFGEPKSFSGTRFEPPVSSLPVLDFNNSIAEALDSLEILGLDMPLDSLDSLPQLHPMMPDSLQNEVDSIGIASPSVEAAERNETLDDIEVEERQEDIEAQEAEEEGQEIENAIIKEEEDE